MRTMGAKTLGRLITLHGAMLGSDPCASPTMRCERVLAVLTDHVELGRYEVIAISLWAMHTFVFDKFVATPRLMLESPVRGCGKTTVLVLLEALGRHSLRFDGVSPAGLFRLIERDRPTLLCDEVDTYGLKGDGALRQVLNSGHRRGGRILRATRDGGRQQFSTFAPVALAAIGTETLPAPSSAAVDRDPHEARRTHSQTRRRGDHTFAQPHL